MKVKVDIVTMLRAAEHVQKYARRSNAIETPPEPYMVRWPLSSSTLIRAADTHLLTKKVAEEMVKRKMS